MEEEIAGEGVEGFERKNISSVFSKIERKLGQRRVTRRPRAGCREKAFGKIDNGKYDAF